MARPPTASPGLYDLKTVAIHEFGHILGLSHCLPGADVPGVEFLTHINNRNRELRRAVIDELNTR